MLLTDLTQLLAHLFSVENYPAEEQGGIFYPPGANQVDYRVDRIGLALEPKPGLADWIIDNEIDTLWLHRPWQFDVGSLPANVVVLYHHLPFDEHLTIGYNSRLASALALTEPIQLLGVKQAPGYPVRPVGMIGIRPDDAEPLHFIDWCDRITEQFGGYDEAIQGQKRLTGMVAVVGAMNDALVREAADRGASLYITGQNRKSAQQALEETGLSLLATGHRRSEEWGLRVLATILLEQTSLNVMLA